MVWSRMTPGGRALAVLLPLLSVGGAALTALLVVAGPFIGATIGANLPIVRFLAASVITFLITVPVAFLLIYMEMKIIALMNLRIGPDRIGPAGAVMSVVHGLKVLMKEDFTPPSVDVPVFTLAPVVVYLASFMTIMVIPFAPDLTSVGLEFGLLYFFAIGGLGVVGLMMAGWSSFNKYSLLGGIRAAAQAISYEIPLTLSVVGIIILTGTLSLPKIVEAQSGSLLDWFIFRQPLAAIIFFIAITAEANRTPFDNTEADQESRARSLSRMRCRSRSTSWRVMGLGVAFPSAFCAVSSVGFASGFDAGFGSRCGSDFGSDVDSDSSSGVRSDFSLRSPSRLESDCCPSCGRCCGSCCPFQAGCRRLQSGNS